MYNKGSYDLIETACIELDYTNGDLVSISDEYSLVNEEKIDWIKLCETVDKDNHQKIKKIFFVNEEPLIVFSKTENKTNLYKIYNRVWCMSRPRLLFLETLSELIVLDLAKQPFKSDEELTDQALVIVKGVQEIKSELADYRREQVESGRVFEDSKFADLESRADRALIRDLKIVRNQLFTAGLDGDKIKYAHSLIGKSIFIRYLEDRGILSKQYFLEIANGNEDWRKIVETESEKVFADPTMRELVYPRILSNKRLTYKLYKQIAKDFNGDIFPTEDDEETIVTQKHLTILKNFLDGNANYESLFFWAYRFDIIPIELISNIYEEFYHFNAQSDDIQINSKGVDNVGTHYTPSPLVEFVLRRTLSEQILVARPIVLDPACGSGIFLVEAFRKMVRYELFASKKKNLNRFELLTILEKQIRGIELNEEAIKIAAFSLYLALLHYQSPPDIFLQIKEGKKLPHLIYCNTKKPSELYFDILLHANAFEIEKFNNEFVGKRFGSNCAQVVLGNPPWGSTPKNDEQGRVALKAAIDWCTDRQLPLSDKERSQAFLWKALDALTENGICGMLVSSGILLKQSDASNIFKQSWVNSVTLKEVVNFIHVRDVFFNGAISPFVSVVFKKAIPTGDSFIDYWTARRTKIIEHTKAIILDKTDFKFFAYNETAVYDIWKIFYFGNHRDLALISKLRVHDKLAEFEYIPKEGTTRRQGFIEGNRKLKSDWLKEYQELPANCFNDRYARISFKDVLVDVPNKVKERGVKHIYEGKRILIGKISQKTIPKGQLIARLETRKFSFRNTINCIKLKEEYKAYYDVILGILWSSLSRYYFFMTASKWGVWHDQVYADEILRLPIALPSNFKLADKISEIVNQLKSGQFNKTQKHPVQATMFDKPSKFFAKSQHQLEQELDKYIFQLYKLSEAEIDLVKDRCDFEIDFFYNDSKSVAVAKNKDVSSSTGELLSIESKRINQKGLQPYLYTFINLWNREVEDGNKLVYKLIYPQRSPLIAVVFELKKKNDNPSELKDIDHDWREVLQMIDSQTQHYYSSRIYVDGIIRIFSDTHIIIIKRDEQRLWTRTAAREDVDATILQAILKQEQSHA